MINSYIFYFINIIVLFVILLLPPDGFSYFKTFVGIILLYNIPGYLILKALGFLKEQQSLYSTFILSFVTGFSIWFVPLFITSQFRIPIPSLLIYSIVGICFIIFLFLLYKGIWNKNTLKKISGTDLIMIVFFNILLFVYLSPLKGLLVAPLHDPTAISVYAKKLIDSNYILTNLSYNNSFYPPAGYYFVGLVADLMKLDPSKTTMIITNISNVLTGFSFAALMTKLLKKRHLGWISVFVFSFLSTYPAFLYSSSGKNAQTIAFVFLFGSLYLFYEAIGKKISFKLLFGLILISSALLHYNNLLITLVLCIPIYIYKLLKDKYTWEEIRKDIFRWLSILVIVGAIFYIQLLVLRNINCFYSSILKPLNTNEKFVGLIGLTDFFNWFLDYDVDYIGFRNSAIILTLGLFSYMALVIKMGVEWLRAKRFNKEILFCFLILVCFYLALYVEIGAITRYFSFNKLILFLIPISFVINLLFNKDIKLFKKFKLNYLLIIIFLIIGGWNMYNLYEGYNQARFVSVVREEDIEAFEWIDENIPEGSYIIPAHIQDKHRYVLDSSLYMKAFTNSYELFPFVYGEKPDNQQDLKTTYLSLKDNPTDISLLEKFTSSGIYYIFSGSHKPWGCGELPCGFFDDYPDIYEVVYERGGVKIYKIIE